jgi:hypothetical protein
VADQLKVTRVLGVQKDTACPRCGKTFVRRVPWRGVGEQLLRHLGIYPFRCQLCTCRYRVFQLGARHEPQLSDIREYDRLRIIFPATLQMSQGDIKGTIRDLSVKGCWVEGATRAARGTMMRVSLYAPSIGAPVIIDQAVVRWTLGAGMGLEFVNVEATQAARLGTVVEALWLAGSQEEPAHGHSRATCLSHHPLSASKLEVLIPPRT